MEKLPIVLMLAKLVGRWHTGGIVGFHAGNYVTECLNNAKIVGGRGVGGIVGESMSSDYTETLEGVDLNIKAKPRFFNFLLQFWCY